MATSISTLSRRIHRSFLLSKPTISMPFCTSFDDKSTLHRTSNSSYHDELLEGGVDNGVYRAILVGQVGQPPLLKTLPNGKKFVLLSVGTGGINSNRTPLLNEDPKDYANRCFVQWHRVRIYQETMGDTALKHAVPGSIVYLEGSLETRAFTDGKTGLARRLREIAIRRDGRIVFLGKGVDDQQQAPLQLKGVGYF